MIGTTINFKEESTVITGTIKDKILIESIPFRKTNETHYLVLDNNGHVHIVHPTNIMDINP